VSPAAARRLAAKLKREAFERLFAQQLAAARVAPTIPQHQFALALGRKWTADFAWPDYGLICEIQGGGFTGGRHTRGQGYEDDCERQSVAATLGYAIVPVTPRHVKDGRALRWVQQALVARGWKP